MGVYSSQALKSWAARAGWPGAPSGRPQSPGRSGTWVARLRALAAPEALHVELLSHARLSVPVTALFMGQHAAFLPADVSQFPALPGAASPVAGPAVSPRVPFFQAYCCRTPSPGTRESPHLSLINTPRNDSRAYAGFFSLLFISLIDSG